MLCIIATGYIIIYRLVKISLVFSTTPMAFPHNFEHAFNVNQIISFNRQDKIYDYN